MKLDPQGNVAAALGGAPFNTARACGRLGADVAFVGALSVDRFGTMLATQLEQDGVSTEHLPRCEEPTTLAAAELDERGTATYRFYFEGTSAPSLSSVVGQPRPSVLFTGGLGLVLEPMATTVEGKPQKVNMEGSGKWLGADCGTVKPVMPPKVSSSSRASSSRSASIRGGVREPGRPGWGRSPSPPSAGAGRGGSEGR